MLIGNDDCSLRISRDDPTDWYAPLRLEARLRLFGKVQLTGWSDVATITAGSDEREAFEKFTERRAGRVRFTLGEDGWLELAYDQSGHIDVLFVFGYAKASPHWRLSGSVHLDDERTQAFLDDFRELIFGW